MEQIKRAWRGEEKLWKVFWNGYGFYILAVAAVKLIIRPINHRAAASGGHTIAYETYWAWLLFWTIYFVLFTLCVWRCRKNVVKEIWSYVALFVAFSVTLKTSAEMVMYATK